MKVTRPDWPPNRTSGAQLRRYAEKRHRRRIVASTSAAALVLVGAGVGLTHVVSHRASPASRSDCNSMTIYLSTPTTRIRIGSDPRRHYSLNTQVGDIITLSTSPESCGRYAGLGYGRGHSLRQRGFHTAIAVSPGTATLLVTNGSACGIDCRGGPFFAGTVSVHVHP